MRGFAAEIPISRALLGAPVPPTPAVSVILPTFNERDALPIVFGRVRTALASTSEEVIVVDDSSPDGTAEIASALCAENGGSLIRRPGRRGLASAVLDGMARARGDVVAVLDADGSHPPEVLPQLVAAIQGGAEFALASRHVPGGSAPGLTASRRAISSVAGALARPLTTVHDPMSGYFAVRRRILERAPLRPVGYKIALEVLVKCRPRPVVEVPFRFGPRIAGVSKLGQAEIGNYLAHLTRLYAWSMAAPFRASTTR